MKNIKYTLFALLSLMILLPSCDLALQEYKQEPNGMMRAVLLEKSLII